MAFTILRLNPKPNGESLECAIRGKNANTNTLNRKGGSGTIRQERKLTAFTILRLNPKKPNGESLELRDQREERKHDHTQFKYLAKANSLNMAENTLIYHD